MGQLLNLDWGAAFRKLASVAGDPASNPIVALLLVGIVSVVIVILLILAMMFVIGRPGEEEYDEDEDEEEYENMYPIVPAEPSPESEGEAEGEVEEPPAPVRRPRAPWTVTSTAIAILVGIGIWVATGWVTSQSTLCTSCHAASVHAKAGHTDPHSAVACVSCHETGGTFGALTYMVGPRAIHFVSGIMSTTVTDGYSRAVPSSACLGCHSAAISGVVTVKAQAVRVSHKEPVAAGAQCVDCHALVRGAVSATTVGMSPCLRCHDGRTASSTCTTCHTGDIAVAVRPSAETTVGPQDLIGTPNCYTCHQPQPCDACHGIRMPHTQEFMQHGHARAAALDYWFGGGKTCSRCHTATRNPCSKCHADLPGHGMGPSWAAGHQYGSPTNCSVGCHGNKTGNGTRSMCSFCHDTPVTPRTAPAAPSPTTPVP